MLLCLLPNRIVTHSVERIGAQPGQTHHGVALPGHGASVEVAGNISFHELGVNTELNMKTNNLQTIDF